MKKIILVSKAAGGKDFFRDFVQTKRAVDISYTSRPIRVGEIPGYTYNYISKEEFEDMILHDAFFENVYFNNWHYGTSRNSWENNNFFILTPSGVKQIPKLERKECIVVFLDTSDAIRRGRLERRSDSDKTERRLLADNEDFKNFSDYDIRITNPVFSPDLLLNLIKNYEAVDKS